MITPLKTLSLTSIDKRDVILECQKANTEEFVCEIVGRIKGSKVSKVANSDGEFTMKLTGEFYARDFKGEEYSSDVAILPSVIHQQILNTLADAEDGTNVEFAIQVFVRGKANMGRTITYEYSVKSVLPLKMTNAVDNLKAMLPGAPVKQIAASEQSGSNGPLPVEKVLVAAPALAKKK